MKCAALAKISPPVRKTENRAELKMRGRAHARDDGIVGGLDRQGKCGEERENEWGTDKYGSQG